MGFVVREQDEDDGIEVAAADGELGDGDSGDRIGLDVVEEPPAWRAVPSLSLLSDTDAAEVAQRLAAAWLAPDKDTSDMTADELEDNRLLAEVYDDDGHAGFVGFLRHFGGTAGTVGSVLATGLFLSGAVQEIRSATRYKRAEIEATANELVDLLFDDRLDDARQLATESLTNLWLSLARSKARNVTAKRMRRGASALQAEAAELLVELGAEVPEGK